MAAREATINCTFCGKDETQVRRLVAGSGPLRICDECVESSSSLLLERPITAGPLFQVAVKRSTRCSFCGAKQSRVWKLLDCAGHYICSECVEIANLIAADSGDCLRKEANAEELKKRNKKHWVWDLSWGDYIFMARWR